MKKYKVNVNGTDYEIAVELMSEEEIKASENAKKEAPKKEEPKAAAPSASAGEGEKIESPMPGTILDVKVKAGATVKSGDVLMILEAMKMENEIMAGADGTVTSVCVAKGTSVEAGTLLCTIK